MHSTNITLSLGGTGKTGRRVAERLPARGRGVRIGSRSGQPPFSWEDRSTWDAALHCTDAACVSFAEVGIDEYAWTMRHEGRPDDAIALITYLFTEVMDGRNAQLTDGTRRALGRAPRDFAGFAQPAAARGAWSTT